MTRTCKCKCGGIIRQSGEPYWDVLPSCSCANPEAVAAYPTVTSNTTTPHVSSGEPLSVESAVELIWNYFDDLNGVELYTFDAEVKKAIKKQLITTLTQLTEDSYETGYRDGKHSRQADWNFLADEYPELCITQLTEAVREERDTTHRDEIVRRLDRMQQTVKEDGSIEGFAEAKDRAIAIVNDVYKGKIADV